MLSILRSLSNDVAKNQRQKKETVIEQEMIEALWFKLAITVENLNDIINKYEVFSVYSILLIMMGSRVSKK